MPGTGRPGRVGGLHGRFSIGVMRITVKLFATFRKGRVDAEVREVSPGTTVSGIVHELRLPGSVGILFVNSRRADMSQELSDGDTVSIFPLVGGG